MIHGIHHIGTKAHDATRTLDFYTRVLGLHLVKQTVRYDTVSDLALYLGDRHATPGTLLSVWVNPGYQDGAVGKGQVATVAFSIGKEAVNFWDQRLQALDILAKYPQQRGEEVVIYLEDPDGLGIELVANGDDDRPGIHSQSDIPEEMGIKGIRGAEVWLERFDKSAAFLQTHLGASLISEQGFRFRYGWPEKSSQYIDIVWGREGAFGIAGTGAVDHVGFLLEQESDLWKYRETMNQQAVPIGPLRELSYYRSFPFQDPSGILYELNSATPGFLVDESAESLGQQFVLPVWEQFRKEEIMRNLPLPKGLSTEETKE